MLYLREKNDFNDISFNVYKKYIIEHSKGGGGLYKSVRFWTKESWEILIKNTNHTKKNVSCDNVSGYYIPMLYCHNMRDVKIRKAF